MEHPRARWVERENVQKRTFTRWINLHLEKCNPPLEVNDLFVDIQDGRILMALLEVLTGQSLLHEYKSSAHRIFRLNNIAKALKFLEDSNVKLVSIDAAEIADGNPSLVLGLIWNIILFLQIKELTGNLNRMSSSSSLSSLPSGTESDTSHPSTPSTEKSMSVSIRDQRRAIKALLNWVQQRTRKYGVAVQDFAGSWRSGLAFLAVIKAIDSSLVDMKKALERSPRENLEDAFTIAKKNLNIPRLLEPEDVMVDSPDAHSIMTYVTQFLEHFPELDPDEFAEEDEEAPLEMTYVRYTDGPTEEEGKIITVSREEDKGYTVELHTRPLTPPETYAEVDIPYDKPTLEKSETNPFEEPTEKPHSQELNADSARLTLDNVIKRLELSPRRFDAARRSPVPPEMNGEGNNGGYEVSGDIFFPSGKNLPPYTDSSDAQSTSTISPGADNISDTSSLFSFSGKEPTELFYQKEVGRRAARPEIIIEDADSCKYVIHEPSDGPEGGNSKQLTVFQAYRASDNDSRVQDSETDAEGDVTDGSGTPKISIIPHDLFYYPHYSVPISDVLQAFADTCPDSLLEQTFTFDVSSEERTGGDTSTLSSGVYLDTESTGSDTSIEESQEIALGLEDYGHNVNYIKIRSQEPLVRSMPNGSVTQATREGSSSPFPFHPGYNSGYNYAFQDVGTDSSEEEWKEPWSRRDVYVSGRGDLEDEDLPEKEDQEDKEATETEEFWLTRDIQNDSGVHRRGERSAPGHSDSGAYKNLNGEGEQLLGLGKQQTNKAAIQGTLAVNSSWPFSALQPPDTLHLLIALWILCYFLLILPELDLSKVSFFVESD